MRQRLRLLLSLAAAAAVLAACFLGLRGLSRSRGTGEGVGESLASQTPSASFGAPAPAASPTAAPAPSPTEPPPTAAATPLPLPEATPEQPEEDAPEDPLPSPPKETAPAKETEAPPETPPPTESPRYLLDAAGEPILGGPGLADYDGYTYYFYEDGTVAMEETLSLESGDYCFDEKGRLITPLRTAVESSAVSELTGQLVVVVDHRLTFWEKGEDGSWKLRMDTYCGYGANGLVPAEERVMGTRTTPMGCFPLTLAFGTGENPGTEMTYRQITARSYWSSGEDETFNTWVESDEPVPGEHLADYYQYKYAVNIGFNLDPPVFSRGCAIFLHCKGTNYWHTAGCVSLEEQDMLDLLLALRDGAYILIAAREEDLAAW